MILTRTGECSELNTPALQFPVVPVDYQYMRTILFRRPRPRVLSLTTHWRIVGDVVYRDCLVQLPDGTRRIMGVRDELLEVAA